jgi:peroxiredoxin Q/BCP
MSINIGDSLPNISRAATNAQDINLQSLSGQPLVLYFYPRDNTPGCTQEGQDFRDNYAAFNALNTRILGVSRDTVRKHENFRKKYDFPFDLLADEDETLCNHFELMRDKKMFGKPVRGIERSTFLFDSNGILRQVWNKVKIDGHVDAVLAATQALIDAENSPEFHHVAVTKAANIYFDGAVTSRVLTFASGEVKTLGIMMVGEYTFNTEKRELMQIQVGEVSVLLPDNSEWQTIKAGEEFEVPANASFQIKVLSVTDYCCSYFD